MGPQASGVSVDCLTNVRACCGAPYHLFPFTPSSIATAGCTPPSSPRALMKPLPKSTMFSPVSLLYSAQVRMCTAEPSHNRVTRRRNLVHGKVCGKLLGTRTVGPADPCVPELWAKLAGPARIGYAVTSTGTSGRLMLSDRTLGFGALVGRVDAGWVAL